MATRDGERQVAAAEAYIAARILEVARRNGHVPLGTCDRNLAKLDRAERI